MKLGLGLGLPFQGGEAAPLFMLDSVGSTALAAYSFRQLSSSYTGPVVRVRRASDNTEQDFGALSDPANSDALDTFLSATTGLMVTKYDQSGNSLDMTVAAASAMQIIKDADDNWCARAAAGKYIRKDPFFGAKTNVTFSMLWRANQKRGTARATSPNAGFDFDTGISFIASQWTGAQSPMFNNVNNNDFDWIDSKPRHHIWKFLNGTESSYEFSSITSSVNTVTNPTYARFSIGKNDFTDSVSDYYEEVFFDGDASEDEILAVVKYQYPAWFNIRDVMLDVGDSNTAAGFVTLGNQWTARVYESQATNKPWFSRAIGSMTAKYYTDNPGILEFYFQNFNHVTGTAIIHLGTNDLEVNNDTGLEVLATLELLADRLRAAGATRVIVVTALPRTFTVSNDTERAALNSGLIANANGKFDDVVDTTSNANLEDETNATYFLVDQVHLTSTGQAELATMINAVL